MDNELKEVAAYCAAHIRNYEVRVQLALDVMDEMRCPLSMADSRLSDEIIEHAEEWAEENGYAVDFIDGIDVEEIVLCGE